MSKTGFWKGEIFFCETEIRSFLAAHITDDIMTDAYRIDFSNEPVFHAFPSFSKECQIYFRKQRHLQRFLKVMVNLQKSKDLNREFTVVQNSLLVLISRSLTVLPMHYVWKCFNVPWDINRKIRYFLFLFDLLLLSFVFWQRQLAAKALSWKNIG